MPSVSKEKQINTTKHFGGGVNVSAGATLLIKAGALSLTQSHPRHRLKQLSREKQNKTQERTHADAAAATETHTVSKIWLPPS